jgi:DNA-damage-inducible protein J
VLSVAKSASVFARIEPGLKEQAENILEQLGIPMSEAIHFFLRQVVLQRGLPFEMKLQRKTPLNYSTLSDDQFTEEIEKGLAAAAAGKVSTAEQVAERLRRDYGV